MLKLGTLYANIPTEQGIIKKTRGSNHQCGNTLRIERLQSWYSNANETVPHIL